MTCGDFYNLNKEIYDKEALNYMSDLLKNKGDMAHRPYEMMTHYTRMICEQLTDDLFLVYNGYVKNIEYNEYNEGRRIKNYCGKKDDVKVFNKQKLIEMFGFEISINPNSQSNKAIQYNAL